MSIKEFIWNLFPYFYDNLDTYKDHEGKGLLRRFMGVFGEEVDQEIIKLLNEDSDDYFLKNVDPETADDKFINILADILGNPPIILDTLEYRKLLQYIVYIYKVKGSKLAYQIFFGLLGFNVSINEIEPDLSIFENRYDTGLRYDTGNRYDYGSSIAANRCSFYELTLTPIDPEMTIPDNIYEKVQRIISFIEPINARLKANFTIEKTPSDIAGYGIPQKLYLALQGDNLDEYITIFYDANGNISIGDEFITFDSEEVTFDSPQIRWSQVRK